MSFYRIMIYKTVNLIAFQLASSKKQVHTRREG